MRWDHLCDELGVACWGGPPDLVLREVTRDHRRVGPGSLFVAVEGARFDGHAHLDGLPAGAAVLLERGEERVPLGIGWARVEASRRALAHASAVLSGHPATRVPVVGITGTNGKTTVAWWLSEAVARVTGRPTAYVGTLGARVGATWSQLSLTTPEAPELQRVLACLGRAQGALAAVEVSSVGLVQRRVDHVPFHVAVFTMLGRDHLDVHGTMAAYAEAKAMLFQPARLRTKGGLPRAIMCGDDAAWRAMAPPEDRWRFGFGEDNDVRIASWDPGVAASTLRIEGAAGDAVIHTPALGRFNALNLTAAWAAGVACGLAPSAMAEALSGLPLPSGRMMRVPDAHGRLLVVDYAHTPDALAAALTAIREVVVGEIHVVFGCGGERDRGKRPAMGRAAGQGADHVWVTSDNPRGEDPARIAREIAGGIEGPFRVVLDRAEAIGLACAAAGAGDAVLVAGKGHEQTQIVGDTSRPFDDAAVLAASAEVP